MTSAKRRLVRRERTEVLPTSEYRAAEALTQQIADRLDTAVTAVEEAAALVLRAYDEQVWAVLGFESWGDYVRARLPKMSASQDLIQQLSHGGMSQRAIAAVTGLSQSSVSERLASGDRFSNSNRSPKSDRPSVEVTTDDAVPADISTITGQDGKVYPTKATTSKRPQKDKSAEPRTAEIERKAINASAEDDVAERADRRIRPVMPDLPSGKRPGLDFICQSIGKIIKHLDAGEWDRRLVAEVERLVDAGVMFCGRWPTTCAPENP
jgi:hypothetical protein